MSIKITFPGNLKVDAEVNGFTVHTDQPIRGGGDDTAPSPFDLFLSSMASCAGIFVLSFCKNRGLDTEGIYLEQDIEFDPVKHKISKVNLSINVPPEFPEKYYDALVKTASLCSVKKAIEDPPEFNVFTKVSE
jgi:ribosomal protein S12 methylthiotransferase accessory factor